MSFTILTKELDGIIRLQGVDGGSSVYEKNGTWYAEGKIALVISIAGIEYTSTPATIEKDVLSFTKEISSYFLAATTRLLAFDYPLVTIQKASGWPVLYFDQLSIYKAITLEVAVEKLAISIIGPVTPDTGRSSFYYNSNYAPKALSKKKSSVTGRNGFFVIKKDGNLLIDIGGMASSASLDHFGITSIELSPRANIVYDLIKLHLRLITSIGYPHYLVLTGNSGWDFDKSSGDGGYTFMEPAELTCENGWLYTTRFHETEAAVSRRRLNIPHEGLRTKIQSDTNRLQFFYPLEMPAAADMLVFGNKNFIDGPQLLYTSDLHEAPALKTQHYGIRVRGLLNDKGVSVKLDADLAVIRFDVGSNQMQLIAGGDITVKGKNTESIVVPKQRTAADPIRSVKIPCIPAMLVVQATAGKTGFVIDTLKNTLIANEPQLETSPVAPANINGNADRYDKLNWKNTASQIKFALQSDEVKPDYKWLDDFRINPATSNFTLLNHQNTNITYDPPATGLLQKREVIVTRTTTLTVNGEERQKIIYLSYASILGLPAAYLIGSILCDTVNPKVIYSCLLNNGKEFLNIRFNAPNEDPAKLKEWMVNQNVNELTIAFYGHNDKIKSFIDDNIKLKETTQDGQIAVGFWPLYSFIGIPLIAKEHNKNPRYVYELIKENPSTQNIICGLGIDMNGSSAIDIKNRFGFTPTSFDALANEFPVVFPYYLQVIKGGRSSTINGSTDLTDPAFIGMLFRNMPLMLQIPTDKLPKFMLTLIDQVNKNLFLEFGYKNDKGFSWIARMPEGVAGTDIILLNNSIIRFSFSQIGMIGHEGRLLEFSFSVFLGLFQESPGHYKVALDAHANLSFNDKGVDNITITPNSITPLRIGDVIPGFEYIRFRKFNTNGKTMFADVDLYPDEKLVDALPIFQKYQRQSGDPADIPGYVLKTSVMIDLESEYTIIAMSLQADIKPFGKWPMSIKAVTIRIGPGNQSSLEIAGDFNLGVADFVKIGGRIIISKNGNSWDYDIQLDKIGGSIALSDDIRIEGEVGWGKLFPPSTTPIREAIARDQLMIQGRDRDFYGILKLKSPGIFGNGTEIFVKIASENGAPFWVCGIRYGQPVNLGFARLVDGEIYVAKNSDYNNKIDTIVTNINNGISDLRQNGNVPPRSEWLQQWKYSSKTGLTIVASGYLVYDMIDGVVTVEPTRDKLTALLYSSAGIIRIEGWIKMFEGLDEVRVLFTIDLRKKRLLVGLQLPSFTFPAEESPTKFKFSPGEMLFGTSFGGPLYLLASCGWPPEINGSFERDWSKAITLSYQPAQFPLPNSFAGGFKFELDLSQPQKFVLYAMAFKAGWSYEVKFGIGKAGLEVSIGGVLALKYVWSEKSFLMLRSSSLFMDNMATQISRSSSCLLTVLDGTGYEDIREDYLYIQNTIAATLRGDLYILGEVFADVKGYAEVSIFGITLLGVYVHAFARMRLCGDTGHGITFLGGEFGAEFCVKIGCYTYCKSATIGISVIDKGGCGIQTLNYQFLPSL